MKNCLEIIIIIIISNQINCGEEKDIKSWIYWKDKLHRYSSNDRRYSSLSVQCGTLQLCGIKVLSHFYSLNSFFMYSVTSDIYISPFPPLWDKFRYHSTSFNFKFYAFMIHTNVWYSYICENTKDRTLSLEGS